MVRNKFIPQDKARVILESLNTNISAAELCRKYNISPPTFYQWEEKFEVQIKGKELKCLLEDRIDCIHVGFTLALPEVRKKLCDKS